MTKIRCQICGGEKLHTEGSVLIICDDCGNRSYVIPESAITEMSSPVETDIVTIKYNRRETDCPRKSICLNDTMFPSEEPCKICNVVRHKYETLTHEMIDKFEERQVYLNNHPELKDEYQEEQEMFEKINQIME